MWVLHLRRFAVLAFGVALAGATPARAEPPSPDSFADWQAVEAAARGGEVFFFAWGGDERINAYIAWAGEQLSSRYGVSLEHVKLDDTASAVGQVLAEKTAGRTDGGSIDLIWINGENFRAMKDNGLLWGPFAEKLPSWRYVDVEANPTTVLDSTLPTDGYESPWGASHFNIIYDSARIATPPQSADGFLDAARAAPGRLSYPAPPDFYGTSFLKQMLLLVADDTTPFYDALEDDAESFADATAPLWAWLDSLHPHLWRDGSAFPESGQAQLGLMNDGELWNGVSFSLLEAAAKRGDGLLPESARTAVMEAGSLANTHFLAIPYNSDAAAASLVAAEFFLSPEAQARKQDITYWGDASVLSLDRLDDADVALFAALPGAEGGAQSVSSLSEIDASWSDALEAEWLARYAR